MRNPWKLRFAARMFVIWMIALSTPMMAHAFGPPKPTGPVYTLPNPLRDVVLRSFTGVSEFETPNLVTTTLIDATASLNGYLVAAVSAPGNPFSIVTGDIGSDPCGTHLEIWPQILDFELNSLSLNLTFGFNPAGTINVGSPQVGASDTLAMGNVSALLTLYNCDNETNRNCTSIVSTTADQSVVENEAKFNVVWSEITGSGDIFNKSDLGKDSQQILNAAVQSLISSPEIAQAPWQRLVQNVNPMTGAITFLAGSNNDIAINQYFTVYAANTADSCGAVEALACIATTEVDGPSSVATVYRTLASGESRPIQVGDVVEVGDPACSP